MNSMMMNTIPQFVKTTQDFIAKAKIVHGDKYDYSKVNYTGTYNHVTIICPAHGEFKQQPKMHLRGQRCAKCVGVHRLTKDEFIDRAIKIHGDKYDYHNVNYINCMRKVDIMCDRHGIFHQKPNDHLGGHGCPNCAQEESANIRRKGTAEFIKQAKAIHGDKYDYSKVVYIDAHHPVIIICSIHGEFSQQPNGHITGRGCRLCANAANGLNCRKTQDQFILDAQKIHGNIYDYSLVDYSTSIVPVTIICPDHGLFEQQPVCHICGCGCPICNESRGERKIRNHLNVLGLDFVSQKMFRDCKDQRKLPFDIFIPTLTLLIEYDGYQHFNPVDIFGGVPAFEVTQKHDRIKEEYAKSNGYTFLRISYEDFDNIENILSKTIDSLKIIYK